MPGVIFAESEIEFHGEHLNLYFCNMFRYFLSLFVLLPVLALVSCQGKQTGNEKLQLTVSIIPQKYLVKSIAGDKSDILVMLPPGSNHETYEPAPRDMEKISSSQLYLALGALDFELSWLDRFRASNPRMNIVNTSKGIDMISGHVHEHENNHDTDNLSHGFDPHTWLSVACMKIQAANICEALSAADTANAAFYKHNLGKFTRTADSVDAIIREKLANHKGKTILIFHPALAYFARDYELTQISIEQDGKEPSPAYMAELVKTAKEKDIRAVFISKEFDTRNAEAIAREINGKVVVFDPMAEDWPANMVLLSQLIDQN